MANLDRIISAVLVACIIAAAGFTVYIVYNPPPGESFTEFYILGPSGKATGYPTNLTLGETGTVILGVVNHEYQEISYRIVIGLENMTLATIDDVVLDHEAGWECNYTFAPGEIGEGMRLDFFLYRDSVKETYRSLHLWLTVSS